MDLSQLSNEQLLALRDQAQPQANPLANMSNEELLALASQLQPAQQAPNVGVGRGIAQGVGDIIGGGAQLLANALPSGVVDAVNRGAAALNERFPVTARLGMTPATPEQVTSQVSERSAAYEADRAAAGQDGFDIPRVAGQVLATLPIAARLPVGSTLLRSIPAGAAAGAVTSALQPVQEGVDYWQEKARQAGLGAAFGGATGPVAHMIGRAIAPQIDDNVRLLANEGVQMTPGQIMGGIVKRAEDASTSLPLVGDVVRGAQQRSTESFNRAALNRALRAIDQTLPDNVPAGRESIQYVDRAVSEAYRRVLPKMVGATDQQFSDDVLRIWGEAQAGALPAEKVAQFQRILDSQIFQKMGPNGVIDGARLKQIESQLGKFARDFTTSANADDKILGSFVHELQASFRSMLTRVNPPELSRGLAKANEAFANLVRAERAAQAAGATEGVFTPAQLSQAVRMSDSSSRRAATARGEALMQDLSDAGRAVLPPTMGDSGTTTRALMNAGTLGGLATALVTGNLPVGALAGGAAAMLPYTQMGQSAIQKFLTTPRPELLNALGQGVAKSGGAVAFPAASALVSQ